MSRTFSLGRLMIGVTLFCIACGLSVNFPQVSLGCAILGSLWAPTIIVCIALAGFSRQRANLFVVSLCGALLGWLLVPGIAWTAKSGWQGFMVYWLAVAIPPAMGALLLGGLAALADVWDRLRNRS